MIRRRLGLIGLLTIALTLASCGGGGGSSDGGMSDANADTTGSDTTGSTDGDTTGDSDGGTDGETGGGTFFNDGDGLTFANGLGATISRLSAVGFGGADGPGGSGSYDCDSGSVTSYTDTDDASGEFTGGGYTYNDCVIDGVSSSGSVSYTFSSSADGSSSTITMTFDNFTSNEDGEVASINGTITVSISGDDNNFSYSISGPSLDLVDSQGAISFTDFTLTATVSSATGSQSLGASATITDESGTIGFSIDPAFSIGAEDLYPGTGQLDMTHSDGSSITINADSGNPETFLYTISDGSSVTSGEERWDDTDLVFDHQ